MNNCPNCNYELEDTWRFCERCGSPRPAVPGGGTAPRPSAAKHARPGTPLDSPRVPVEPPPAPSAADGKKTPTAGRGAVPAVIWGAFLALLGWMVWLITLWGPTHGGQGYGDFGQAYQQFASAVGQLLPDYHLDLAGTGLAVAFAVLIAVYLFTQVRNPKLAAIVLGLTAVLAAIGVLMVGSVVRLGSEIWAAQRACDAVGAGSCLPAAGVAAVLGGWIAVGGGGLALLGGLLCARSATVSRRTAVAAAGAQAGVPATFRAAETAWPSGMTTFSPVGAAPGSRPGEPAARACSWCHAPVPAGYRFCSRCGQSTGL